MICSNCSRPVLFDKKCCEFCLSSRKRTYAKNRKNGLCGTCGKVPTGRSMCPECHERSTSTRLKSLGLCIDNCGNPIIRIDRCEFHATTRNEKYRNRYTQLQQQVFLRYGNRCNCCGETEKRFLSVDHVENNGNKDVHPSGWRVLGSTLYARIIKADFPDTYQILCMNCNFGKARNNGVCPHEINNLQAIVSLVI